MTEASPQILVADDEPAIRRLLRTILATQGYSVTEAHTGNRALEAASASPRADLLLLDLTLPDMDGFKIIRELRCFGLVDADHRFIEPERREFQGDSPGSRCRRLSDQAFRRAGAVCAHACGHASPPANGRGAANLQVGELAVDLVRRVVTLGGEELKLSPKEYALLSLLVRNAGKVLTHSHILKELWSGEADTQYIRIYIRSLRQKLREAPENPSYILTEQGVGYRFREPPDNE